MVQLMTVNLMQHDLRLRRVPVVEKRKEKEHEKVEIVARERQLP